MREIKFRAWVENELVDNPYPYMNFNPIFSGSINEVFALNGIQVPNKLHNKITYMQYTGLKDIKGVEIYEGDIVKRTYNSGSTFIGEVVFEEATYFMRSEEAYAFLANQYDSETLEVIGNIYENPELLEVTT